MYKVKIKLLYNEGKPFCTKTEFLSIKLTLPLAKLIMVKVNLTPNGLIFSGDNPVDIQVVTFFIVI